MVERQKPIVTELALADALDRLVNLIEELRADANLRLNQSQGGMCICDTSGIGL